MANTGYKHYTTRKQVMLDPSTGQPDLSNETGFTEANTPGDNYVPDEYDAVACPVGAAPYSFQIGDTESIATCQAPVTNPTVYATQQTIEVGITLYTTNAGTTTYNGGNKWHYIPAFDTPQYRISTSGVITDSYLNCF